MSKKHSKSNRFQPKQQGLYTLLDIVIPVYGRPDLLLKCLQSIPASAEDVSYRVLIWDNGSKLEDKNIYRAYTDIHPEITIFGSNLNLGFPRACNSAARKGLSPLIFFLNDDVVLYPGSIKKLVKVMDDPSVGIVGMKLIFPKDSTIPNRPAGLVQHVGLSTNIRGEIFHHLIGWSPDNPRVNRISDVYGVTGAALMTRRNLWNKVGGFREEYGIGTYEDIDYCLSIRGLGHKVKVEPQAVGEHFTGATALSYNIPYPLNMNKLIFMQRWQEKLYYSEWEIW